MRNGQAYQQKTEKFSVSEEKKFGKIDSRLRVQGNKPDSGMTEHGKYESGMIGSFCVCTENFLNSISFYVFWRGPLSSTS